MTKACCWELAEVTCDQGLAIGNSKGVTCDQGLLLGTF